MGEIVFLISCILIVVFCKLILKLTEDDKNK